MQLACLVFLSVLVMASGYDKCAGHDQDDTLRFDPDEVEESIGELQDVRLSLDQQYVENLVLETDALNQAVSEEMSTSSELLEEESTGECRCQCQLI